MSTKRPHSRRLLQIVRVGPLPAVLAVAVVLLPAVGLPQTTNITSSGLGTVVNRNGATVSITGGTAAGANLFHSFGNFSLGANNTALFSNTNGAAIGNIVGRVTGGLRSNIAGTIDTLSYPGANLFLINPAGVVFAPGARLSVDGSVHVSTADRVRFAAGPDFHAVPDAVRDGALSVANPVGFGFLTASPAPIIVRDAQLQVPAGQTLSLVGGDVTITGTSSPAPASLTAGSGRVQIGSVASPGDVLVVPRLEVGPDTTLGRIDLTNAVLDAGGAPAGTVAIRGGQLVATGSVIGARNLGGDPAAPLAVDIRITGQARISGGTQIVTESFGSGRSGDIRVAADRIVISGGTQIVTHPSGSGRSGDIRVAADRIVIGDSSIGTTAAFSDAGGAGGDVTLTGGQSVTLSGVNVLVSTTAASVETGAGGNLTIEAPTVTLKDDASIVSRTFGVAAGGDIRIEATELRMSDGADILSRTTGASGGDVIVNVRGVASIASGSILTVGTLGGAGEPVGDILLSVGSLVLTGAAVIQSGDTAGRTGDVTITARDTIVISDGSNITSQAFAQDVGQIRLSAERLDVDHGYILASTFGGSRAGDVDISVGTLRLLNGGQIASSSELGATERGGNIAIAARGAVVISGSSPDGQPVTPLVDTPHSGLFSTAAGSGGAGRIDIRTPDLRLADRGRIAVGTTGSGPAGGVALEVQSLTIEGGARVDSSTTGEGAGGNVVVDAASVSISGVDTGVFSTASGSGDAGLIAISAPAISIGDGGQISVATSSSGRAGDVVLGFRDLTLAGGARIDSSTTGAGAGGSISISGQSLTLAGSGTGLFSDAGGTGPDGVPGAGPGGDLHVSADTIRLADGAILSATSRGPATALAGSIDITTNDLRLDASRITTESALAAGGNITIAFTGSTLILRGSQITTSVRSGLGGGGNIAIGTSEHPLDFLILNNGGIHADAFGGPGGNISIFADLVFSSVPIETAITASSALSAPGSINISAPITDVSGSLTDLPTSLLEVAAVLRASCTARLAEGKASSLVVAGREGVPREPGGLLSSALGDARLALSSSHGTAPLASALPPLRLSYLERACGGSR